MTNISVINNIQILNMYDKLITAFDNSNLSINSFSKATGISEAAIESALEKNINGYFTINDMLKLSKYLNIKIHQLF